MIRVVLLLLVALTFSTTLRSQEYKRNANWVVGLVPCIQMNFTSGLQVEQLQNLSVLNSSACISDTQGKLVLYSSGFTVNGNDGLFIENGHGINCPYGDKLADYYGFYSDFDQMSIILPKQGNQYYVFSVGMSDTAATKYLNHIESRFDVLNYSVVDMDSNAGKGKVIAKNVVLADSQRYQNACIHAVRHGNGKDWWLCKPDCENHRFQLYLVKEDTIEGPYYKYVPQSKQGDFCQFFGSIEFNPQGDKLASSMYGSIFYNGTDTTYDFNRVDIYNFDRCTGDITYSHHYQVPFDTTTYSNKDYLMGLGFSPNGKLLYATTIYNIHQIEIANTSINAPLFITGPDTNAFFPWYNEIKAAPDGRMYVGTGGVSRPQMSYIANPDVVGLACNFTPNGIWQPYTNLANPPNMPNYGLGAICWPTGTQEELHSDNKLLVYPNPSSSKFYIKHAKPQSIKELYNSVGQLVLSTKEDEIDVSKLAKGVYYLRCAEQSAKVVVE